MRCSLRTTLFVIVALTLSGCGSLQRSDPIQVTVAGIEPLPGEGLELRMMVKLRVQNPNDVPVEYDGVYLKLEVLDKIFATGVSDRRGSVPRFGEAIVGVPVTVSVLRMVRHALGMLDGKAIDKINYVLDGKLNGPVLGATRFQSQGELTLPAAMSAETKP
jgi:LEA14-like dessication related protein